MEKEDSYSAPNFTTLDYGIDHNHNHHQHQQYHHHHHHESTNYLLNNLPQQQQQQHQLMSFADVMHFADFGPKLALNQTRISEEEEQEEQEEDDDDNDQSGIDPVYFLKFPVLNDKNNTDQSLVVQQQNHRHHHHHDVEDNEERLLIRSKDKEILREEDHSHDMNSVQLQFLGEDLQKNSNNNSIIGNPSSSEPNNINNNGNKNKRKRPRTVKTSEEVESQRMTHIAVERNRRKQMNEHLRVLRSLMPGSYVQRGDQASIIGGAIEFVRELEQLLQCLESQKRRRLLGDQNPRPVGPADPNNGAAPVGPVPPFFPSNNDDMVEYFEGGGGGVGGGGLREETAENKSCLADVEVKLLGFDAMIKILSRRRPGQLIKAIAALEDLQFNILHTNITTIEQTVLYSFNVKVTSESRFSAEDIASSVQQIFSFIHANTTM